MHLPDQLLYRDARVLSRELYAVSATQGRVDNPHKAGDAVLVLGTGGVFMYDLSHPSSFCHGSHRSSFGLQFPVARVQILEVFGRQAVQRSGALQHQHQEPMQNGKGMTRAMRQLQVILKAVMLRRRKDEVQLSTQAAILRGS